MDGTCSRALLASLEGLLKNPSEDVGLDLRALHDPTPSLLATLKRLHRLFQQRQRVLVLFSPPTRLVDLIQLDGSAEELNIYREDEHPRGRSKPAEEAPTATVNKMDQIVHFEKDLERASELEACLDNARRIALRTLCRPLPTTPPFAVSTAYLPHDKIGGDFFVLLPAQRYLGIGVGDVSGHGIDAALLMGMSRKVLEIRAQEVSDPADVLNQVNRDLYPELDRYTFVTGFYAALDRETGRLCFARAGHVYPLLYSPALGRVRLLESPGIAFGIDPGETFERAMQCGEAMLGPGDVLIIYTDGLVEAQHPHKGPFGVERLMDVFRGSPRFASSEEVRDRVIESLQAHLEGHPLGDDLTLISVLHDGEAPEERG